MGELVTNAPRKFRPARTPARPIAHPVPRSSLRAAAANRAASSGSSLTVPARAFRESRARVGRSIRRKRRANSFGLGTRATTGRVCPLYFLREGRRPLKAAHQEHQVQCLPFWTLQEDSLLDGPSTEPVPRSERTSSRSPSRQAHTAESLRPLENRYRAPSVATQCVHELRQFQRGHPADLSGSLQETTNSGVVGAVMQAAPASGSGPCGRYHDSWVRLLGGSDQGSPGELRRTSAGSQHLVGSGRNLHCRSRRSACLLDSGGRYLETYPLAGRHPAVSIPRRHARHVIPTKVQTRSWNAGEPTSSIASPTD